jgi:hypothetical protein
MNLFAPKDITFSLGKELESSSRRNQKALFELPGMIEFGAKTLNGNLHVQKSARLNKGIHT